MATLVHFNPWVWDPWDAERLEFVDVKCLPYGTKRRQKCNARAVESKVAAAR
jgi:hypothetical protein